MLVFPMNGLRPSSNRMTNVWISHRGNREQGDKLSREQGAWPKLLNRLIKAYLLNIAGGENKAV